MKHVKKVKKPSLPKLKKTAWKLWSKIVRKDSVCKLCGIKYGEIKVNGKPAVLNAHHVIGRENHALSWDLKNGISLCQNCHKYSKIGAHKGGIIFSEWFRITYPDVYDYLLKNYNTEVNITVEYIEEIIKKFKETAKNEQN